MEHFEKYHFVFTTREIDTLQLIKPDNILISYYHWQDRNIKDVIADINKYTFSEEEYKELRSNKTTYLLDQKANRLRLEIKKLKDECELNFEDTEIFETYNNMISQYTPNIILDSGAFSVWGKDKEISLFDYMKYISRNKEVIDNYAVLDEVGKPEETFENYKIMKVEGYNPLPVFHYGSNEKYLKRYIELGEDYIMLGGANKKGNKKVIDWVNTITHKYPNIDFHLLGKGNKKILKKVKVKSADCSTHIYKSIKEYISHKEKIKRLKEKNELNNKEKRILEANKYNFNSYCIKTPKQVQVIQNIKDQLPYIIEGSSYQPKLFL